MKIIDCILSRYEKKNKFLQEIHKYKSTCRNDVNYMYIHKIRGRKTINKQKTDKQMNKYFKINHAIAKQTSRQINKEMTPVIKNNRPKKIRSK